MRRLREYRDISQTALARTVGLGRCAIVEMEQGRRCIRLGEAMAICDALDVSLDHMLRDEGLVLTVEVRID